MKHAAWTLPTETERACGASARVGAAPRAWLVRAPLRLSFGGGGTDLPAYADRHGGLVVSTAIARYCWVQLTPRADRRIVLRSLDYGVREELDADAPLPLREPLVLAKAALGWAREQGRLAGGLELTLASDAPPGSGLGGSSAMAVALVRALTTAAGDQWAPEQVAATAAHLEIERLGWPIGRQDHYASALGGLNALEFGAGAVRAEPLRLAPAVRRALEARLLLFWTGRTRAAASILAQQHADTERRPATLAALHQLKALAAELRAALEAGALDAFGALLHRGWLVKQQLSPRIAPPAIQRWYAAARAAGALGGKVAGAGGGGFLLLYCPPERQGAVRAALAAYGLVEVPVAFEPRGVRVAPPGSGAVLFPPALLSTAEGSASDRGPHPNGAMPRQQSRVGRGGERGTAPAGLPSVLAASKGEAD
ncbi:MAG TPA: GHMP kinase [Chloroflexota bacterium]|jgi:D-glycero-alpha-D-manno-heptose-7-phosphate kinase|nr:GHMP kinase [Chloroflexota bacterium]